MKQAFTLVELLVVVLIIGVLTSIAIPMYQGAVDKSHWSTMLPAAKSIKDAEEAIKMTNGEYTSQMDDLDVTMNNENLTFALTTPNNMSDPNVIRVTNPKLANVRLASYLEDSPKFAGQLHCEAKTGDDRATRLCEKLLGGQYVMPIDNGYTAYLLDQEIDEGTCKHAEQSWSTSKTKCYRTDEARCTDLGNMNVVSQGRCGFNNENGKTIGAEGICSGTSGGGCKNSIVENGGECVAGLGDHITNNNPCSYSTIKKGGICRVTAGSYTPCAHLTIEEGGMCVVEAGGAGDGCGWAIDPPVKGTILCNGAHCGKRSVFDNGVCVGNSYVSCLSNFTNGSICYANYPSVTCSINDVGYGAATYDDTSCCCGDYCGNAPKCSDRGIACDPQYMK